MWGGRADRQDRPPPPPPPRQVHHIEYLFGVLREFPLLSKIVAQYLDYLEAAFGGELARSFGWSWREAAAAAHLFHVIRVERAIDIL